MLEQVAYFISDYLLLYGFAAVIFVAVAGIIYRTVTRPKNVGLKQMTRDVANIYDPITGLPYSVIGKQGVSTVVSSEFESQKKYEELLKNNELKNSEDEST